MRTHSPARAVMRTGTPASRKPVDGVSGARKSWTRRRSTARLGSTSSACAVSGTAARAARRAPAGGAAAGAAAASALEPTHPLRRTCTQPPLRPTSSSRAPCTSCASTRPLGVARTFSQAGVTDSVCPSRTSALTEARKIQPSTSTCV
jgi:hypothetical protein